MVFARATPIEEVISGLDGYADEEIAACINEMIAAGVIIRASEPDPIVAARWERSALAFHRTSRRPDFQAGLSHDTAAVAPARSEATIALEHPVGEPGCRDLAEVLESRRSWRVWPNSADPV
jgi:hypothetical protein